MRGLAVIVAAAAAWVLATGTVPRIARRALPAVPDVRSLVLSVVCGAAAGIIVLGLVAVPSVAIAVGVLVSGAPQMARRLRERRQREVIASAWPDVLARMRSRLAGGATLVEAFVDGVATAPPELAALAPRVDEAVRYGAGFVPALDEMRTILADPVADRVTTTLAIANSAGGGRVGEVLSALSTSVADELRLRRAHHAAMTEQRLTAAVALIAPWVLLGLTLATNPQAAAAYSESAGTLIVAVGLAGTGVGYLLAVRSARLAEPPRVFE